MWVPVAARFWIVTLLVCVFGTCVSFALHNDTSPLDKKYKNIIEVIVYFTMTINHVSCECI